MRTLADLTSWLGQKEVAHLEFKEAKSSFDWDKLVRYCAALANEGGGDIVLGVGDKRPRKVVGTSAFANVEKVAKDLLDHLALRIEVSELHHPDGRVLVFTAPSRPIGRPIPVDGAYWMRVGESLETMTPERLQRIFDEGVPDFSAKVCSEATLSDLAGDAIERFRSLLARRRPAVRADSVDRMLEDAELTVDGGITYAALIMLGAPRGLGRHLGCAEIVYEYRADEASVAYSHREDHRTAFLLLDEALWRAIDQRNTVHQFVDGLFRRDIPSFNERAVREALLNAVCHRDYRLQGSIFVKQWPSRLEISSPGGFPPGITVDNILFRQAPRNRRLAEAFARCGLVERSGQGVDLMFATAVQEGKAPLDFSGTDEFEVRLTLHGTIEDEGFLRFLEKATRDAGRSFNTHELVVLDAVHRDHAIPQAARPTIARLIDQGFVERAGKRRLVVARKYQRVIGKPGAYTRKAGLDRETNKALLLKHISSNPGCALSELCGVLPNHSTDQVRALLKNLKDDGAAYSQGRTRAGRWFARPNQT